jgi:hypothetical protein
MTIRHQTVLPALVVSPSTLTVADVKANVISCYFSFSSISGACSGVPTCGSDLWQASDKPKDKVVHQVLLFNPRIHNVCGHVIGEYNNTFDSVCNGSLTVCPTWTNLSDLQHVTGLLGH